MSLILCLKAPTQLLSLCVMILHNLAPPALSSLSFCLSPHPPTPAEESPLLPLLAVTSWQTKPTFQASQTKHPCQLSTAEGAMPLLAHSFP